jgi:predicted methyltransferase
MNKGHHRRMAFWRRKREPLYRLAEGGRMQVRGESNYQQQLHRACANGEGVPFTDEDDCWDRAFSVTVCLRPEPTNPYDRNAVAVHIAGDCVGYLSRKHAAR